jgi:hypothetical protein
MFTRESCKPVAKPTPKQISNDLRKLRSYGKSTFAHLSREDGSYVQVGGGGVTCVVERRDREDGEHLRAFYRKPRVSFEDGTVLSFGAGKLSLMRDEFLAIETAIAIFVAFLNSTAYPEDIHWRDVSARLGHIAR